MITIQKKQIEEHRLKWSIIARENGWYVEPFFIQLWVRKDGTIRDSVSFIGIQRDYVCDDDKDKVIKEGKDYTIV